MDKYTHKARNESHICSKDQSQIIEGKVLWKEFEVLPQKHGIAVVIAVTITPAFIAFFEQGHQIWPYRLCTAYTQSNSHYHLPFVSENITTAFPG